jgi:hypothetical protein
MEGSPNHYASDEIRNRRRRTEIALRPWLKLVLNAAKKRRRAYKCVNLRARIELSHSD